MSGFFKSNKMYFGRGSLGGAYASSYLSGGDGSPETVVGDLLGFDASIRLQTKMQDALSDPVKVSKEIIGLMKLGKEAIATSYAKEMNDLVTSGLTPSEASEIAIANADTARKQLMQKIESVYGMEVISSINGGMAKIGELPKEGLKKALA